MAVLDIQRRGQQIGRIRIGQQVATKNGGTRPARLDTFRLTTASRHTADAIAGLYGGTVREWEGQYEVITDRAEIGVTVPPRDEVISQWYETWNKGGAVRRCDSQREQISNGPCQCPHAINPNDPDEVADAALRRAELAKTGGACKLVTRISVMIPDLPGLGVFRLDTGSYYAGVEIGDSAALMQYARDHKVMLPAMLRIEQRKRVAGGTTKNFPVPVLEVIPTFRELTSGALEQAGVAAQLPPAPGEQRRAITAAPAPAAAEPPQAPSAPQAGPLSAQQIADIAPMARTRADVEQLVRQAAEYRVSEDLVCTNPGEDVWEELREVLRARWRDLSATGADDAG